MFFVSCKDYEEALNNSNNGKITIHLKRIIVNHNFHLNGFEQCSPIQTEFLINKNFRSEFSTINIKSNKISH